MLPRIGAAWSGSGSQVGPRTAGSSSNQALSTAKPVYSRYSQPVASRPLAGSDSEADSFAATESDELSSDSEVRSRSAPLARPRHSRSSQKLLSTTTAGSSSNAWVGQEEILRVPSRSAQNTNPNGPRQVALRPLGQDPLQQQLPQQQNGQKRADMSGPHPRPAERVRTTAPSVEVYDMSRRGDGGGAAEITDSESDDADGGDTAGRSFLQKQARAGASGSRAGGSSGGGGGGRAMRTKYGVTVEVDRVADMSNYSDFDRCARTRKSPTFVNLRLESQV